MSQYEVIARKWRPQTFEKLIGQNHVAQTLLNALQSERIPHALLFTGPRGTGKTSSARILAKALRCTNSQNHSSCGECNDCVDIARGRHIDVIEIDGASNNGVDSVRELRDSVGYLPSTGKYKIYIIDEVHMLSTSAFNALLKTLEEPPEHVIFIMATTEVHKLPNTILSRCQRFDFKMISQKQIQEHLAVICDKEQVNYDEESLWLIAKQAKGSMRDAQSLLDQLITFSKGQLKTDLIIDILGLSSRELIHTTLKAISEQDPLSLTPVIQKISDTGSDPQLFIEDLLEQLRNALMVKIGAHKGHIALNLPDSEIQSLTQLTESFSEEDIHLLFDITLKGSLELARTTDSRLALEMLLLKLTAAPRVRSLENMSASSGVQSGQGSSARPKPAPRAPQQKQVAAPQQKQAATAQPRTHTQKTTAQPQQPTAPPQAQAPVKPKAPVKKDVWGQFVDTVRQNNGFLAALLEHTFIIERTKQELRLGIPQKMVFLIDKLNDPKNKQQLVGFVSSIWNENLEVTVAANDGKKQPTATPQQKKVQAKEQQTKATQEAVENHPLVKKANHLFKTELVSIREEKNQ